MKQNPFKELVTNREVPLEVRKKVMTDVETVKLLMKMGDLFTTKYGSIMQSLLKTKKRND